MNINHINELMPLRKINKKKMNENLANQLNQSPQFFVIKRSEEKT